MNIITWNVNGIRAVVKKGFLKFVDEFAPDILCIQETKANEEILDEKIKQIEGYYSFFSSAVKKGYSGVCVYSKIRPIKVEELGNEEFDSEGRGLILYYDDFILINCYFPNSQSEGKRLSYKVSFCDYVLNICNNFVKDGKNIILCGDYNIAPQAIDLEHPESNKNSPGYFPQERECFANFQKNNYIDLFRKFYPEEIKAYTWWSYRSGARSRNVGWRIDHFCCNESFLAKVEDVKILKEVLGSDHAPVVLYLK